MDKMFRNSPFTGPSMKASEKLRDQMNNYLTGKWEKSIFWVNCSFQLKIRLHKWNSHAK